MELSVDAVVYNASRRFWLNAQPLIMLLRTLISIFQSSALFLFEFDPDLCVHFMNCILLVFMDEHLDLLHQAIAIEAERHLALNQRDLYNDASFEAPHSSSNGDFASRLYSANKLRVNKYSRSFHFHFLVGNFSSTISHPPILLSGCSVGQCLLR